jgi:hypothetical protein
MSDIVRDHAYMCKFHMNHCSLGEFLNMAVVRNVEETLNHFV